MATADVAVQVGEMAPESVRNMGEAASDLVGATSELVSQTASGMVNEMSSVRRGLDFRTTAKSTSSDRVQRATRARSDNSIVVEEPPQPEDIAATRSRAESAGVTSYDRNGVVAFLPTGRADDRQREPPSVTQPELEPTSALSGAPTASGTGGTAVVDSPADPGGDPWDDDS